MTLPCWNAEIITLIMTPSNINWFISPLIILSQQTYHSIKQLQVKYVALLDIIWHMKVHLNNYSSFKLLRDKVMPLCMETGWAEMSHEEPSSLANLNLCLESLHRPAFRREFSALPTCPMLSLSSQSWPSRSAAISSRNTQRAGMPFPALRLGSPWKTQGMYWEHTIDNKITYNY